MIEKLQTLWPEITLFVGACVVMIVGLSASAQVRRLCWPISAAALIAAGLLAYTTNHPSAHALPNLAQYGKVLTAFVGLLLIFVLAGTVDRQYEADVERGTSRFDPLRSTRGEFYALFLFSLMGLMLCSGADDLIWLFLALELVSLPTYIMVAIATARNRSMEAGIKYFFLGAMGAATFLYGFALIYGATGATNFAEIKAVFAQQLAGGGINAMGIAGIILAIVGVSFKIAAVPMHFYTPDVYQGASAPVAAFLAFVPKTAGFISILLLTTTLAWIPSAEYPAGTLPPSIHSVLWIIAVLTMTIGNTLALLQTSLKRILAYSSIAHSGYMLVGIIVGPGARPDQFSSSGIAAVLFYLLVYGVMNLGAFAVVASLQRPGKDGTMEEIDSLADLRGLCITRPVLGWTMVICAASMLGLPPLLGFFGKLPLFTAGMGAGHYTLIIIMGINSAIGAVYYLRLAGYPLLEKPDLSGSAAQVRPVHVNGRWIAGVLSAVGIIALAAYPMTDAARIGAKYQPKVEAQLRTGALPAAPVAKQ